VEAKTDSNVFGIGYSGKEMPSEYSVTLIHGTFARGSAWTSDTGVLAATLRQELEDLDPGCSVEFEIFVEQSQ
jgi:hypothetical protein